MTKTPLLEIEDLCARVGDREIIKNFNLTVNEGEVHAVMGAERCRKIDAFLCFDRKTRI